MNIAKKIILKIIEKISIFFFLFLSMFFLIKFPNEKLQIIEIIMIGDRKIDIISGKKAGCKTIFIDRNYKEKKPTTQNFTTTNLKLAVKYIALS